jgi:hypothetical protein
VLIVAVIAVGTARDSRQRHDLPPAEIQLNAHSLDGKLDRLTRLRHVIPVAKYLKNAPAEAAKPAAAPAAAAPPATEQKKD